MEPPKDISPVGRPSPVSPSRRIRPAREAGQPVPADHVSLSEEGKEILAVRQGVEHSPDVRDSLVQRLRREIAEGLYRPPAAEIARRLARVLRRS